MESSPNSQVKYDTSVASTNRVKCVTILDKDLPSGLLVNTAAVLAATIGRRIETIIGEDILDGSGSIHVGLIKIPIPILAGTKEMIRSIRSQTMEMPPLLVVDVTHVAQESTNYPAYKERLLATSESDLIYLGLSLYGPAKLVGKLTGNLPLLR
jgi:hypothetical protein